MMTDEHPDDNVHSSEQLLAMLKWYRAAGVDIAVAERPVDRFAERGAPAVPVRPGSSSNTGSAPLRTAAARPAPASRNSTPPVAQSTNAEPAEAEELAQGANNLEELRACLENYQGCGLKLRATRTVFADGNPKAKIMLIGEAPGRDEDLQGKPFVGRSGQLLDRMLRAIGLDRTSVYIANTVPWRPPGNRTPSPMEISLCLPFLVRQVELVAPKIIVTLGAAATQTMFEEKLSILKTRGRWRDIKVGSHSTKAMPTLHPAFLLRQPAQKRQAWQDMLALATCVEELGLNGEPD